MTKITLPPERQVGHLTLIRQGRDISLEEFELLARSEQIDIVHQYQGKDKFNLLISIKEAKTIVPSLHPQDIYLTVNELGAEDAAELLAMTSPEQINLLLDLDCWENDNLSPVLSLHWLGLLLNSGADKCNELIRELEPEVLALFLKKHLTITHGIEVFDSDDEDNAKRLESLYDIDYASEDAAKIISALLKTWLEHEQESYLLVMEMIRSEQLTSLEEEAYQSRSNRLLDLGIIPTNEARSIYAYCDPDRFEPGGKTDFSLESEDTSHPKALLALAEPTNLLADILGAGIDHAAACELMMLVNRKMSADNIDISSSDQVLESLQTVYDTLNLALEFLAGTDSGAADQVFSTTYLIHLFQLGHSLTEQRRKAAVSVSQGPLYPYLDYPELLFIDSLLETPPCLYIPEDGDRPASLQRLRTIKDLNFVDLRLDQLNALAHLFLADLPFDLPVIEEEIDPEPASLAQLLITAVANQILDRGFVPQPLSVTDLNPLKEITLTDRELDPAFIDQFKQLVRKFSDQLDFFSEFCLGLWEESLCSEDQEPGYFLQDD